MIMKFNKFDKKFKLYLEAYYSFEEIDDDDENSFNIVNADDIPDKKGLRPYGFWILGNGDTYEVDYMGHSGIAQTILQNYKLYEPLEYAWKLANTRIKKEINIEELPKYRKRFQLSEDVLDDKELVQFIKHPSIYVWMGIKLNAIRVTVGHVNKTLYYESLKKYKLTLPQKKELQNIEIRYGCELDKRAGRLDIDY